MKLVGFALAPGILASPVRAAGHKVEHVTAGSMNMSRAMADGESRAARKPAGRSNRGGEMNRVNFGQVLTDRWQG